MARSHQIASLRTEIQKTITDVGQDLDSLRQAFIKAETDAQRALARLTPSGWDEDAFGTFIKKPYAIRPLGAGEYEIVIPRCAGVIFGYVHSADDRWIFCRVNRLTALINPLPKSLANEIGIAPPSFDAQLSGNILNVLRGDPSEVSRKIGAKHIVRRDGRRFFLRPASVVEVAQRIIEEEGFMPFTPQPIPRDLLRLPQIAKREDGKPAFTLRPEQQRDYLTWRDKLGMATLVSYFQLGKSFLVLQSLAELKSEKIIFCRTRDLCHQWRMRIATYLTPEAASETEVVTLADSPKILKRKKKYSIVIVDEAHRVPSDTGTRIILELSYVSKWGLSATPKRADGKDSLIPALTGPYIGGDWDIPAVQKPKVIIWVVENDKQKFAHLKRLVATPIDGKTLVMTFLREMGQRAAATLDGVPFVHGGKGSGKLVETIEANDLCVASNIADEGLSIPNLRRIVEINSLGGNIESGQRAGRLANTTLKQGRGEFHIIITHNEIEKTSRRLLILEQFGLEIDIRTPDDLNVREIKQAIYTASTPKKRTSKDGTLRKTVEKIPSDLHPDIERLLMLKPIQARLAVARKILTDNARAAAHLITVLSACRSKTVTPKQIAESHGQMGRSTIRRYKQAAQTLAANQVGLLTEKDGLYSWNEPEIEQLEAIGGD